MVAPRAVIEVLWIPLGAGQHVVKWSGRIYEALSALFGRRPRADLYHTALLVTVDGTCYVVESAPVPDGDGHRRGVVAEGPVGLALAGRLRIFRYEVRRWPDGVIPDLHFAVQRVELPVTDTEARRVLDLAAEVPSPVWGRDELRTGDMWNSNSVTSWVLARAGVEVESLASPEGGRSPGWDAGITVARRGAAAETPE